ncbi:MAG: universal stress protein [Spirochaetales bacterium]|nr:universal stress protein [Spirochaetales bacterium]
MPHRDIYNRILFCTDFSQNAGVAFLHALNIASGNADCELIIFHVVPEPNAQFWKSYIYEVDEIDKKAKTDIDEKIAKEYVSRIPEDLQWSLKASVGKVEQKILEAAERENTDLIVMGRGGSSRVNTWFFGDTAGRIVRKAPCPVLVVPGAPVIS